MRVETKKIYYCEYCKKKSMRKDIMKKHEKICTENVNRECGICKLLKNDRSDIKSISEIALTMIKHKETSRECGGVIDITILNEAEVLDYIREKTNSCPNCILSVIKQIRKNIDVWFPSFKYKNEFEAMMQDINADRNGYGEY